MAALSLIMSAVVAHAQARPAQAQAAKVRIPITSLPITITAAGSYYLPSDMYFSPTTMDKTNAILVNSTGTVTLDLNGHTLSGPGQVWLSDPGWNLNPGGIAVESSNVTIRNGSISGFFIPMSVFGPYSGGVQHYISNIEIEAVTFSPGNYLVLNLNNVNNSIVRNCHFTNLGFYMAGITDGGSQTGNSYINDTFSGPSGIGISNPIQISLAGTRIIVHRLTFQVSVFNN